MGQIPNVVCARVWEYQILRVANPTKKYKPVENFFHISTNSFSSPNGPVVKTLYPQVTQNCKYLENIAHRLVRTEKTKKLGVTLSFFYEKYKSTPFLWIEMQNILAWK